MESDTAQDEQSGDPSPLEAGRGRPTTSVRGIRQAFDRYRPRWSGPRWVPGAMLTVVSMAMVWRLSAMTEWSWYQDDWAYMGDAVDRGFWDYVLQSYNGHLMPAQFALFWIWDRTNPMDYSLAITALAVLGVVSMALWIAAFRRLIGDRGVLLIPTVILGLSPLFLPATLWPASGLQTLSLQAAMGACVYFTAAWWQDNRARHLIGLAVSYVVGLVFWEKALLIVVPVVGLLFFLRHREQERGFSRRLLAPGVLLAAVSSVYLVAYLMLTGEDASDRPGLQAVTLAEVFNFFRTGFLASALPALLGGPWNAQGDVLSIRPSPTTLQQWLIACGAAALLCTALVFRRGAWIMLGTTVGYVTLAWGIVLMSSRYTWFGDLGLLDGRYIADTLPVLVLCGMLMLLPLRDEPVDVAYRQSPSGFVRRHHGTLTLVIAAGLAVSSLYTNTLLWDRLRSVSPKPWVTNATASLIGNPGASFYDSTAPRTVVAFALFDWNQLSEMMRPLRLPTRFNQPDEQLVVLDGDGLMTGAQVGDGISSLPGPIPGCGYLIQPGETAFVPMTAGTFAWEWGLEVDYLSQEGGILEVTSDQRTTEIPLAPGLGTMQAVMVDSVSALRLSSAPGSGAICVSGVRVGTISPGERLS